VSDKSARILERVRLNRKVAGHADILATSLARKSTRMSVSTNDLSGQSEFPFRARTTEQIPVVEYAISSIRSAVSIAYNAGL